ncbi:MAG: glycosyltransferase [Gemmatimonadaceae bacterium]|nr:glycosyltransferase [Acetobacteraceae bacterium]
MNEAADLLCFSHLRWEFVFQRPQHLMTRAARTMRVLYWEEPVWTPHGPARLDVKRAGAVLVMTPVLPWGADPDAGQRTLLDAMIRDHAVTDPVLWYYTPHALAFSHGLRRRAAIYDCMDELAAFAGADPDLPTIEATLMHEADLVFTGGHSLYEARRTRHPSVHAFPSGVDTAHFMPARTGLPDPADQREIGHPRMGFYGVLDERLDRTLLAGIADLRPGTQFVLVGPTAKLDPQDLPVRPNLHYLGPKHYADLPAYVANWQVALMPFALNGATRFISPTKTPEYLAAGLPVVSTPVPDVVRQYGAMAGVQIAADAAAFAACTDRALTLAQHPAAWLPGVDAMLAGMSWDTTWSRMAALMDHAAVAAA